MREIRVYVCKDDKERNRLVKKYVDQMYTESSLGLKVKKNYKPIYITEKLWQRLVGKRMEW